MAVYLHGNYGYAAQSTAGIRRAAKPSRRVKRRAFRRTADVLFVEIKVEFFCERIRIFVRFCGFRVTPIIFVRIIGGSDKRNGK